MAANDMDAFPPNSPTDPPTPAKLARAQVPGVPVVEPRRIIPVTLPSAAPPGLSTSPDAMALLKSLRRRWLMAVALGCLVAGLAGIATWYLVPAKFLATTTIRVDSKQQIGVDRMLNPMAHQMAMKTNSEHLKGKDVLLKALKEDGVRNLSLVRKHPNTTSALMWMEESLKVEYREGSELLNVLLTGEEPQDAVRIVEALTSAFMQVVNGEEKRQRNDRVMRYAKLLEEAKEKLREKNAEKEALQKANSGGKMPWSCAMCRCRTALSWSAPRNRSPITSTSLKRRPPG